MFFALFIIFSSDDSFIEFSYTMKVPLQVLKDHGIHRKYKYHVESPLTKKGIISQLEFIAGINARNAVIDRCLKLHVELSSISNHCKFLLHVQSMYIYVCSTDGYESLQQLY